MCGVFGIRSVERDVARISYFGLFALQHRGQESAGIAVSDDGRLTVLRDMGLVADVRQTPDRWRRGDTVLLAEAGETIEEQAELIAFLSRAAPLLTLAHDVGNGGLERALAQAAEWSGVASSGAGQAPRGSVVLACEAGELERLDRPGLRVLGSVA